MWSSQTFEPLFYKSSKSSSPGKYLSVSNCKKNSNLSDYKHGKENIMINDNAV